jgi:hypothetical protein
LNTNTTVSSSAQYSIDNGTLFPFQVAAKNSTVQIYNLTSFQTPALSPGPHRLFAQYSSSATAPLVLDHLIIQTPPLISSSQSHARLSKGAIAGIVIGSLVGVLIAIILIWVVRKRKSAAAQRPPPYAVPADGDGKGQQ